MDSHFDLHGVTLRVSADRAEVMGQVQRFLESYGLTPRPPCPPTLVIDLETAACPPASAPGHWQALDYAGLHVMMDGDAVEVRNDQAHVRIDCQELRASGAVRSGVGDEAGLETNVFSYTLLTLLRHCGLYPMHGAGLARQDAGLLIVADSGEGKSSLAAALLRRGWGFLSDDSLLLRLDQTEVEALPLRRDLFLAPERPLPGAAALRSTPGKVRVETSRHFPGSVIDHCTPRLIVFPAIQDRDLSEVFECPPGEAIHLLAHHGLVADMERSRASQNMAVLAALVRQCRCCRLEAGRDLLANDGHAARLLTGLIETATVTSAHTTGDEGSP